jgi:hypothetical protein
MWIQKLLKYNLDYFSRYFRSRLNGKKYVFFMNLLLQDGTKFTFKDGYYAVHEKLVSHYSLRSRMNLYQKGLSCRVKGLTESYGLESIKFSKDDLIVDVGANTGELQLAFPEQSYIGFEPSPQEFSILTKNKKTNSVIYNYCIGNSNEYADFYISTESSDSSLFAPLKVESVIRIKMHRLDELTNSSIKLLKVDAEGAELEVFEGSTGILRNIEYISADLGFEKGVYEESTLPEVLNLLYKHNFVLIKNTKSDRFLFFNTSFQI